MHTNLVNRFSIKWILITSLGWLVAQTIGLLITKFAYQKAEVETLITAPLYWAIFGIVFGLSQWINLRDRIPHSFRWVLATAMGYFIGALMLKVLYRSEIINSFFREFPIFAYLFGGIIISFAQYQTIKKTLQKANWWIIIAGISWSFAQTLIGLLFFAAITGLGFAWLEENSKFIPEIKTA